MTTRTAPDSRLASVLRFATELIAWVGAPWALAPHSVLLAIASVVVSSRGGGGCSGQAPPAPTS